MPDFGSAIFSVIISIGIVWYIYDARRKHRQLIANRSAKSSFNSSYRPHENLFENTTQYTLEELEDLKDLEAEGWQIGRTLQGNPFKSMPSLPIRQQAMLPIKPCYRRNLRPTQNP